MKSTSVQKASAWNAPTDSERWLTLALGVSLLGHAAVLGVQLLLLWWRGPAGHPATLVYDREPVPRVSAWSPQEVASPKVQLKELARSMTVTVSSAPGNIPDIKGSQPIVFGMPSPKSEATGHGLGAGRTHLMPEANARTGAWAAAVDLTNIAAAAQGDPVLLSYFGTIREQIQRIADSKEWAADGSLRAGIVYVGFVMGRDGILQSAAVVPERSSASTQLCQVALQIIRASSPFLPFPPSFKESSKTIIIPIQFAFGSS